MAYLRPTYLQYITSLINYLQKTSDKGNCIYNLAICIMQFVFIVVDNEVDMSIKVHSLIEFQVWGRP